MKIYIALVPHISLGLTPHIQRPRKTSSLESQINTNQVDYVSTLPERKNKKIKKRKK